MRAVITGGSGFVGRWLADHLRAEGDEVVSVDRDIDVTDRGAVAATLGAADADAVYHLAALTHVGRSWEDPTEVVRVNVLGTLGVLEAARACATPPTVLVVSSAEVYGHVAPAELPITEDAAIRPVTPYAASKAGAESLALQAHLAHGLRVVRVRPFNHIGPGQSPSFVVPALAGRIVAATRAGAQTIPVGNLSARRDLTDVRDVVRAYRLLVQHGEAGEVYNVCSGRSVAIDDIAARLLRLAGASLELVADPDLYRPVDVPDMVGDATRLRAATGWAPTIDLQDTLTAVLQDSQAA